jgi:nucleotide-binding universal stress UspA family protein
MSARIESTVFGRILVGVDGSPESVEAVRQAARLATGEITLLAAWHVPPPSTGGVGVGYAYGEMDEGPYREAASEAVEGGQRVLERGQPVVKVVHGIGWEALLDEVEEGDRSLVAVGSHGQGRVKGVVLGSTTTELVHKAPCPVLVARPASPDFPRRIVVGVDGSAEAARAYEIAEYVAGLFEAELWPVVASGADKQRVREIVGRYEELADDPVRALVAAAADADLVVVGSRGLKGLKSLGSVSERVAHNARCSTLVVRGKSVPPPE